MTTTRDNVLANMQKAKANFDAHWDIIERNVMAGDTMGTALAIDLLVTAFAGDPADFLPGPMALALGGMATEMALDSGKTESDIIADAMFTDSETLRQRQIEMCMEGQEISQMYEVTRDIPRPS